MDKRDRRSRFTIMLYEINYILRYDTNSFKMWLYFFHLLRGYLWLYGYTKMSFVLIICNPFIEVYE